MDDAFGGSVGLSGNGFTLVVGAKQEDSNAVQVNGDDTNNASEQSGAAYIFAFTALEGWKQQAYLKADNTGTGHLFGSSVSLDQDGQLLAVGAPFESSDTTGIAANGVANSNTENSGAIYYFSRLGDNWSQVSQVKATNTGLGDKFGTSVSISHDGASMVVGAAGESSSSTGVGAEQGNDDAAQSGAAYFF